MIEIALVVVVALLIVGLFLTTVQASRTLKDVLAHNERMRSAHHEQLDSLIDRMLARNFEQYKQWELATKIQDDEPVTESFRMPPPEDFAETRPYDTASLETLSKEEERPS